jgi:hypothetical protein
MPAPNRAGRVWVDRGYKYVAPTELAAPPEPRTQHRETFPRRKPRFANVAHSPVRPFALSLFALPAPS